MDMWLGHDLGWWGFVFGITALVLALPLGITGNLMTPMLKNWWATRSQSSLQKRIDKLQRELEGYEGRFELLSMSENLTLRGIESMCKFIVMIGQGILLLMWYAAVILDHTSSIKLHQFIALLIVLATCYLLQRIIEKHLIKDIRDFRVPRSPAHREYLKVAIKKLRGKLVSG